MKGFTLVKPFYYFSQMIRVVVIGSGNVAQHLIKTFQKAEGVAFMQAFARDKKSLSSFLDEDKITTDYSSLVEADVYIISVTDSAITNVSKSLTFENRLVVHTSGSVALDALTSKNKRGVFYPLQTFSKSKAVDFNSIPICLETEDSKDYEILEKLAKTISSSCYAINSEQRKALHVAAVFVNNFVNHLYQISQEICEENKISFEILKPLIQETVSKLKTLSPKEAQTGPAARNDTTTINKHLQFLNDKNQKEIYKILTKSIIDHGKKL